MNVHTILAAGLLSLALLVGCTNPMSPDPLPDPVPATWRVTYDANGDTSGTVPTDGNSYGAGAVVTVLGVGTLERGGYSFVGWNTAADGSGTDYSPGATFTMGAANVVLYAKWSENPTYTVSYDGNGHTSGEVPVDNNRYETGAVVTVAEVGTLAREGHTFSGWNTQVDGGGTARTAGSTFAISSSDIVLYAQWTEDPTYTVSYDGNDASGGTVPVDSTNYLEGATVTVLALGTLERGGHSFAGWNTAADGSGTDFDPAATFTMATSNVVLYARWTELPTYNVTYHGNGATDGTVPVDLVDYFAGATVTVLGNSGGLARNGFGFAGWNTAADGSGTDFDPAATFTMGSAAVVLYARWVPTYTVTYHGNGATGGTVPVDLVDYFAGATVTVLAAGTLEREGYSFAGWNTAADGGGTDSEPGSTLTMGTAEVILYAVWAGSGVPQWARTVTTGNDASQFDSLAVDSGGNVYAAGYINRTGTYTFGPGVSVAGSASTYNVAIVKYNSEGVAQWARTVTTGSNRSWLNSVAVDSAGNVYAAGHFNGTGSYTFGSGVSAEGSSSNDSVVLVKYDSAGTAQWARTVTTGSSHSRFMSVAVDSGGDVYAAGYINGTGTYTFGPEVIAAGSSDGNVVLVKYDSAGAAQWARTVTAGSSHSRFMSVAVDSGGDVYAAGYINGTGTYTFGPEVSAAGPGPENGVLVKYNSAGAAQWARTVTAGASHSRFMSVAVDPGGDVYAAGKINGTGIYEFGLAVSVAGPGPENVLLVKYDSTGAAQWARTVTTGSSVSEFWSVAVDSAASVYASGAINDTGNYTFGSEVSAAGYSSSFNAVLVKYDSAGFAQWVRTVTAGVSNSVFRSLAVDSNANVYAAGIVVGMGITYTFGPDVSATGLYAGDNAVLVKYSD